MGGAVDTGSCAASRSKAECPGFPHPVPEGAAPIVTPLVQGLLPWPLDSGAVPLGGHRPELASRKQPTRTPGRLTRRPRFGVMVRLAGKPSSGRPLKMARPVAGVQHPGATK